MAYNKQKKSSSKLPRDVIQKLSLNFCLNWSEGTKHIIQWVLSCKVSVSTKSYHCEWKVEETSWLGTSICILVFLSFTVVLFVYSPLIKSYPNSKYWLLMNSSISWGCRSFLKVLLLRLLKHWEVILKEEIKKINHTNQKLKWLYPTTS